MKRTSLRALLLIFGILLVSCSKDPGGTSGVTGPAGPEPPGRAIIDLDDLEYETISGTLQPGQSGILFQNLTTWPKNCMFGLIVPESSMPDGAPINFTIRVPTKASYDEFPVEMYQRLVIRLGPSGEQFTGPITVMGTWMPWQGRPPEPLYFWNGSEWGEAAVTYVPSTRRYRVSFQVDHFSDWEVGPVLPPD